MKISQTPLAGVLLVEPDIYRDDRGFFSETWNYSKYAEQGLDQQFVQDNHSRSSKGVLRGLHYQLRQPQGKLVRVLSGTVYDVAVDIRRGSPSFGEWYGVELSAKNFLQLYIPPGFAHGFVTLSDSADFSYKCTDYYAPGDEYGLLWNDPDIGIRWPLADISLSGKDEKNALIVDASSSLPVYGEKT